jgi:hypothetical protein
MLEREWPNLRRSIKRSILTKLKIVSKIRGIKYEYKF